MSYKTLEHLSGIVVPNGTWVRLIAQDSLENNKGFRVINKTGTTLFLYYSNEATSSGFPTITYLQAGQCSLEIPNDTIATDDLMGQSVWVYQASGSSQTIYPSVIN